MPIDQQHDPVRWIDYGALVGGTLLAIWSRIRWKSWAARKKELRKMLQEITDEDALKSVLRHERTHWQRGRKDESDG